MRFNTLQAWLDWQQTLNPKTIDLGLKRVREVYERLSPGAIARKVISVAGTNGKGSTVAAYETWLKNHGYRVASYTSPHLLRYNERIKLDLQAVTDEQLCLAFERIDQLRGEVDLTYFEFGTLAALIMIEEYNPDYAILEVGLGGRLDAVNIIDANLAHITSIGLDHQDWLGNTRELIGGEKAGILRPTGLAVCNDANPPQSIIAALEKNQCKYKLIGRDYSYQMQSQDGMVWQGENRHIPIKLALQGEHQALNTSGVIAGLELLGCLHDVSNEGVNQGFSGLLCAGRLQTVKSSIAPTVLVDVGHNEDAAAVLAQYLQSRVTTGRVIVLLGMLQDKSPQTFVSVLSPQVDAWWLIGLQGSRGLSAKQLASRISSEVSVEHCFDSIQAAMEQAVSSLKNQDILLVTGSFLTVEAALNSTFLQTGT